MAMIRTISLRSPLLTVLQEAFVCPRTGFVAESYLHYFQPGRPASHNRGNDNANGLTFCRNVAIHSTETPDCARRLREKWISVVRQPVPTAVVKRWLAPDLACFVLQKETVWTRNSGGLLLVHTTITPLFVTLEPTDRFFEIPTDYHERTPGEVLRMQAALYHNDIPMPADTPGIDASYEAAHAKPK
jgi:hypothetical protein